MTEKQKKYDILIEKNKILSILIKNKRVDFTYKQKRVDFNGVKTKDKTIDFIKKYKVRILIKRDKRQNHR